MVQKWYEDFSIGVEAFKNKAGTRNLSNPSPKRLMFFARDRQQSVDGCQSPPAAIDPKQTVVTCRSCPEKTIRFVYENGSDS
jgi:hypothetical protein